MLILAISLFFISCKEDTLNNSFIFFSEAQPANVPAINAFPKYFNGTYALDYSHRLIIEPKIIYIREMELITTRKSELDSLPEFELRNSQVFDRKKDKAYKTFIKGDTISFELERMDTIFSFATNEIAKEFKSSLILNKKIDDVYQISVVKVSTIGTQHIQLGTKKDFSKLNANLKIPFQTKMNDNDTSKVILTPSRADFRKLLRQEGFEFEKSYLFNKRGGK